MGSQEGKKSTIVTVDNDRLVAERFISFGFDTQAMAVCEDMVYIKQSDGKYRLLAPYDEHKFQ